MTWRLGCAAALGLLLGGCAGVEEDGPRHFVVTSGSQVGDLYWNGELTDSRDNHWNVWILPGIAPSLEFGAEAWGDSWDFVSRLGEGDYWADRAADVSDGLEFAAKDAVREFWLDGTREDIADAADAIAANVRETPFGWIPRVLGNAVWGFVIKPVVRLACMPVGVAGGASYSVAAPVVQVSARPVGALGYGVLAGTATPVGRIAFHHPAFLFSLLNREPLPRHDGSFGLEIVSGPDAVSVDWAEWEEPGLEEQASEADERGEGLQVVVDPDLALATYLREQRQATLLGLAALREGEVRGALEREVEALEERPVRDELIGFECLPDHELVWMAWGRISALDPAGEVLYRSTFFSGLWAVLEEHPR